MSDSFDWRIIDRHLAGDATADDEAALREWLANRIAHHYNRA